MRACILGKVKNGVFFPSFNLLDMLLPVAANKVVVDRKAAWLFICGRDIFGSGVVKVMGSKRKGDATLVLNEFGECLGFGRIDGDLGGQPRRLRLRTCWMLGISCGGKRRSRRSGDRRFFVMHSYDPFLSVMNSHEALQFSFPW